MSTFRMQLAFSATVSKAAVCDYYSLAYVDSKKTENGIFHLYSAPACSVAKFDIYVTCL